MKKGVVPALFTYEQRKLLPGRNEAGKNLEAAWI